MRKRRIARTTDSAGATAHATTFFVLLLAIPAGLVFEQLGSAGSPAELLGLFTLLLWVLGWVYPPPGGALPRLQPLHYAMFGFAGAVLAGYISACVRPISQTEINAADRGMLSVLAWLGIFVLFSDGIVTLPNLEKVLRRLTVGVGLVSVLGIVQFVTKKTIIDRINIPGLSPNTTGELDARGNDLVRVMGTTSHPIEFGALLATVLPLAIYFSSRDTHRSLLGRSWPLIAIMIALPLSISRSSVILAAIVLAVMLPTLPRAVQLRTIALVCVLGAIMYVAVPGLAGTFRSLFLGVSSDTSTTSRTDSFSIAFDFIAQHPLFGRGFRTFLPDYRILDNQYLNLLIETGFVGLVATVILLLLGMLTGFGIRRTATDQPVRELGVALSASIAAGAGSLALYDAFSFPTGTSALFVSLGAMASLRRIVARTYVPHTVDVS